MGIIHFVPKIFLYPKVRGEFVSRFVINYSTGVRPFPKSIMCYYLNTTHLLLLFV